MSTDPKAPKPIPSADEINAYLEASAARTRLRLPLAKGNALTDAAAVTSTPEKVLQRALPVSGSKKLPTQREQPRPSSGAAPGKSEKADAESSPEAVWQPFSSDGDG